MEPRHTDANAKHTVRLEAFSDAVFAIAITLLVLDLHVPSATGHESLFRLMVGDWATYLAFLIGFFTILVCWINHHYMFECIYRQTGMLLLLNGFKLLVVSFTPFATSVLAKYLATPQQQTAVNIYAGSFFVMGLSMTSLWCYAYRKGLTKASSPEVLKAVTRLYIIASVLSGVILIVSFINVWICLTLFAVMFAIFVFPDMTMSRLAKKKAKR